MVGNKIIEAIGKCEGTDGLFSLMQTARIVKSLVV